MQRIQNFFNSVFYRNNWTTVRLWIATDNDAGHASVQTRELASKWPTTTVPDIQETFYSLDTNKINTEYEALRSRNFVPEKTNPESGKGGQLSCTALTYKILGAGGINSLSEKCSCLEESWGSISPKNLAQCIIDAKQQELKKFPETAEQEERRYLSPGK